jgi:hypothetical protein
MNSGWHGNGNGHGNGHGNGSEHGYSSGSDEHEPSEERGQAAWGTQGHGGSPPPWASAETQTSHTPPPWVAAEPRSPEPQPPWASAQTQISGTPLPLPPPPAYGYQPPPAPPSPATGPRRLLVILTAMAVLGSGIGAGVWFLTRDGSARPGATPGTSVAVTTSQAPQTTAPPTAPPTSPPSTPSVSPLESPPPTPAVGYRRAQDPVGYTLFVPEDWIRRQKAGEKAPVVFYDDPDDGRQLQIFLVTETDAATSLRTAENDPSFGFARQPGYQALDREEGDTWSELSYRYDDEDKGPRQVIDHRFRASADTYYAIRASGPEDLPLALVREPLGNALSSFCLRDEPCL